jgi:hypothetical protein
MPVIRWRTALFFGLDVTVIGVGLEFQVKRHERVDAFYPTYEAAKRDGPVSRGWIPSFVPPSATEIYEEHDLDTNQVWIRLGCLLTGDPASRIVHLSSPASVSGNRTYHKVWNWITRSPPTVTSRLQGCAFRLSSVALARYAPLL